MPDANPPPPQPRMLPSPLSIAIGYAVLAGLWILASDRFMLALFQDPVHLALASALKGWAFVLVTSLLLFLLLRHQQAGKDSSISPTGRLRDILGLPYLGLALLIAATTAGAIVLNFRYNLDTAYARLGAVAELKAGQIGDWLRDRNQGSPQIIRASTLLADWYQRAAAGDREAAEQLQPRLLQLARVGGFDAVSLLDPQGRILWQSEDAPTPAGTARGLHGPYREADGTPWLDLVVPLEQARSQGLIVLHARARQRLFPMLSARPILGESGELLLFRGEGQEVEFLNDLRHIDTRTTSLRLSLDRPDLLAGQVLSGRARAGARLQGRDYHGREVLGVTIAVPESDWYVVAKEDRDEIMAATLRQSVWIVLSGMFALGALAAWFIMQRQRAQLQIAASTRQAQDERLQALTLLEAVVAHSEDCIYAVDRDGRYTLFNRAAEQMVGKPAAEVLGRDERALFPDEIAAPLIAINQRIMRSGVSEALEESLPGVDGPRTLLSLKTPLRDASGKVIGLCGVSRDISQRQASEARLRASEERLRYAFEAANEGLWDWDIERGRAVLSPRYYAITGYTADEVTPDVAFFRSLVHPDDWPTFTAAQDAHLRGDTPACLVSFRMRTKAGEHRWVASKGKVVERAADGRPLRMIGTLSDISEQKQAEEELLAKTAELEARNAELERFNRVVIGRELDMLELKRTINALTRALGRPEPYDLAFTTYPGSPA